MSVAADHTDIAADALMHGNGLARKILSDPNIEGDPLAFLKVTEAYWKAMKQQKHEPHKKGPTVVTTSDSSFTAHIKQAPVTSNNSRHSSSVYTAVPDFDIIMCGGTLGIMVALALQQQGFRVAVVEKRVVQGRVQEWNTSRHECQVLVDLGLMTDSELDANIVTEFNPIRCGFKGGDPLWVNDCLNIGVNPKQLIATLRSKFEALGGVIHEHTAFKSAVVCTDGVAVTVMEAADAPADVGDTNRPNALQRQQQKQQGSEIMQQRSNGNGRQASGQQDRQSGGGGVNGKLDGARKGPKQMSCRLLLDCMGHYSPIVKQLRGRAKPEGMVLVVGGCATGVPSELNKHADLLYSMTDASADMQLFWEAFPAEGGSARTTYMFAYSDAHPSRPSFEHLLDTYFRLLPAYQHLPNLESLRFKRVLFGGFPCYGSSPLQPGFDRVLQLGDASASQSPLSFGGFGCMLRHVPRLTESISHALRDDKLSRCDLSWIHGYQPSLSAAWLFQRSMSIGVGQLQQQHQKGVAAAAGQEVTAASSQRPAASVQSNIVPVSFLSQNTTKIVHNASGGGSSNGVPGLNTSSTSSRNGTAGSEQSAYKTAFDRWSVERHHGQGAATAVPDLAAAPASTASGHTTSPSLHQKHSSNNKVPSSSSSSGSGGGVRTPQWLRKIMLLPHDHINALLGANFSAMAVLGQRVLKPFLQDTLLLGPLALTMLGMMIVKPLVVSKVLCQVGPKVLFGWFGHFTALTAYTIAHWILSPLRRFTSNYTVHRALDLLEYGSSSDYKYHASKPVSKSEIDRITQAQAAVATKAADAARQQQPVVERDSQGYSDRMFHQRRRHQQDEREAATMLAAGMGAAV